VRPCDDGPVGIAPVELERADSDTVTEAERPWITLVWNDPVNLMSYVTYVLMTYFGYDRAHAEKLMLDVHHKGRAVVSNGTREEMERDVTAMHSYGLWATMQKDD
jgi:ATP-dependent Clp protease adaptor protein ClpS